MSGALRRGQCLHEAEQIAEGARATAHREHGAGEHGVQGKLPAGGPARIDDLAQRFGEALGGFRRHGQLAEGALGFPGDGFERFAQARAGRGRERAQPQALGLPVRDVVIVPVAAAAGGRAQLDPAGRLIACSCIPLGIDKRLGQKRPRARALGPLHGLRRHRQAEPTAGEIGLARRREHEEAVILHQQRQPAGARARIPADPRLASGELARGARPHHHGQHGFAAHGQLHDLAVARLGRTKVVLAIQRRARRGDLFRLRHAQRHFPQRPFGQRFRQ